MAKKQDIQAFIQVRMGSNRLPGKALLDIDGKTAVERIVENMKHSRFIKNTVITTTTASEDDALEVFAKEKGISIYRGDTLNLVKRFLDASEQYKADIIVRITGDCPFVSPELTDALIESHIKKGADYSRMETDKLPVGICSEVISKSALKRLASLDLDFDYSEYLTFYFTYNDDIFLINILPADPSYRFPQFRLTLDHKEDLEMFNLLCGKLRQAGMSPDLTNIIKILNEDPCIAKINSGLTLKYQSNKELVHKIKQAVKIDGA